MKNIIYILILIAFLLSTAAIYIFSSALLSALFCVAVIGITICIYYYLRYREKRVDKYNQELSEHLKSTASYSAHLSNVISGINHEVSPWIGGIQNITSRLKAQKDLNPEFILKKLTTIEKACDQTRALLELLSNNIKKLNQYNTNNTNLLETIDSWVNVTLMDRFVKDLVDVNNFSVDRDSLDWDVIHSPMLLAQVILNLVKNSIEHNPNQLDNLEIKFSGSPDGKQFFYEDNGCGIPDNMINNIFKAGITTKQIKTQHGFGLALCMEYCLSMNATIKAVNNSNGALFIISFQNEGSQDFRESVEKVGESSGIREAISNCRTINPQIKGDKTYGNGDLSSMSEKN